METFWRLLESSVIVQALVTLALVSAVVFLTVTGREVPASLLNLTVLSLGYYFGTKGQLTATKAVDAAVAQIMSTLED